MNHREITDLLISWVTISAAFAWIQVNIFSPRAFGDFAMALAIMLVAVGAGFILHELAHKYVAIHYGAHAEFRMWKDGLILAVALALLLGMVFAAPGAVYIFERRKQLTVEQNGIISLAGPLTNIIIAGAGLGAYALFSPIGFLEMVVRYTIHVNFFLAAFNLIPIMPLDGAKVFMWSKAAWLIAIVIAGLGAFLL